MGKDDTKENNEIKNKYHEGSKQKVKENHAKTNHQISRKEAINDTTKDDDIEEHNEMKINHEGSKQEVKENHARTNHQFSQRKAINEKRKDLEIINKCEKCGQICPTFESLIEHHIKTDYIQCGMCHKEFETEYDLEDHEETHRDSPWSDFICETCGEAIQCKDYAQIHYFCHNTPEILEGIRKYKGDIFKLMMKIAPEIISDKIGVLEIKEDKEALAIKKALEIKDIEERRRKLALKIT